MRRALLVLFLALASATSAPARMLIARSVAIGQYGDGAEDFRYPIGVALVEGGSFWVTDWKSGRVSRFSTSGGLLRTLYLEGEDLQGPLGITRDSAGNLLVVENRAHRIRKLDPTGQPVFLVGGRGGKPGKFRYPRGVAVGSGGEIYVADYGNDRVQILDAEGAPVDLITFSPEDGGEAGRPRGLALDPWGRLWVTYSNLHVVVRFGLDRSPEVVIGGKGSGRGRFDDPRYLAFDVRGDVYVTDYNNHRIQKFSPEGRFLYSFGARGSAPGQFHLPEGIAITPRGDLLVADTANYRIQILELNAVDAHKNLGFAAHQRGDEETAEEEYRWVLQREPAEREAMATLEQIYLARGRAAEEAGNLERALAVHEDLLQIVPGHLGAQRAVRSLFWRRTRPLVHYLAIGAGVVLSGLLLLVLLLRTAAEELRRRRPRRRAELAQPEATATTGIRDYAPRPAASAEESPIQ